MAYEEIDLIKIHTYLAADRVSKVDTAIEASPYQKGMSFREFIDTLPEILKVNDLNAVAKAVVKARSIKKPVIVMMGGHLIKSGCSPIVADLVEKGFITHIASNGAAAIHDTELALFGSTSEDVDSQLSDGSFGMAADTAAFINTAAQRASGNKEGFGEAVGAMLVAEGPPHLKRSLLARCHQMKIPYTLHVALGTDIVHQHPSADGAAIGEASLRDFRIFASSVSKLGEGGVVLNFGSAVVMPEVFLKALSVTRNLGYDVRKFVTANFDMIQHYRPNLNVVNRPTQNGGKGYAITGHHEIMIPLLSAAIQELAENI